MAASAAIVKGNRNTRVRSLAMCGLFIALMAVSAWFSIPFGPVPFTLQTFVMIFAVLALRRSEVLLAIGGYLVLGAVGLPVFSSMRGGIGVLAGPTGGFLWGFFLGAIVAVLFLNLVDRKGLWGLTNPRPGNATKKEGVGKITIGLCAGLLFLVVAYTCGYLQLILVSGMSPAAAFAVGVAPFVIIDAVKLVAAVFVTASVEKIVR